MISIALVTAACGASSTPAIVQSDLDAGADGDASAGDAGGRPNDGAVADGSDDVSDGGSENYDGRVDEPLPCPQEGFPSPCTSAPEVVYTCRCAQIHCVNGQMVPTPDSGSPCD